MSIIDDYFKLVPLAFKNRKHIVEGVVNKVKDALHMLPEDEQVEIVRRSLICIDCPYNSKNAKTNELEYKSDRLDDHCIFCSCNIEYKCSCLSCNCGIESFNLKHPDEPPLELKWTKYIKPTK